MYDYNEILAKFILLMTFDLKYTILELLLWWEWTSIWISNYLLLKHILFIYQSHDWSSWISEFWSFIPSFWGIFVCVFEYFEFLPHSREDMSNWTWSHKQLKGTYLREGTYSRGGIGLRFLYLFLNIQSDDILPLKILCFVWYFCSNMCGHIWVWD